MMHRILAFLKVEDGVAAIEFAFVTPFLLILCLGMFETAGIISANMKLTSAAQMMSDLVAQQMNQTTAQTTNFCTGAKMMMSPLPTGTFKASIISVTNKSTGRAVDWEDTSCGGASSGSSTAVGLATSVTPNIGDSVILVTVSYQYTSPLAYVLSTSYTLSKSSYSRPRDVPNVTHS